MMTVKNRLTCMGLILMAMVVSSAATAKDPEARRIMELVDDRYDGDDMSSNMKMVLLDKHNNKRIRDIRSFSLDQGEDTWKRLLFLSPVDVKGTGFLTYDYDHRLDDDQWLYLPALHKSKRIASDDKTSSFMGSDFSYADMTSKEVDDFYYRLLKESKVRENPCWVIESVPKTDKVVRDYGYSKSVLFVRKDCHVVIRSVNWVREGKKLKYMDVKRLGRINGIWTPLEIHMTTKKGKLREHTTILMHSNVRYNENPGKNMFTLRQLEKGI
jgi:hypothetical protein